MGINFSDTTWQTVFIPHQDDETYNQYPNRVPSPFTPTKESDDGNRKED